MGEICQVAWEGGVPADSTKVIIVPVYKGKGRRGECGSYRGISLLSIPGKVYGKVIIETVQRLTEEKISEEQGGFRKGRECVDQIISFTMVVEKILAFMNLEKAYDRVDWLALWDVFRAGHRYSATLRGGCRYSYFRCNATNVIIFLPCFLLNYCIFPSSSFYSLLPPHLPSSSPQPTVTNRTPPPRRREYQTRKFT